MQDDSSIEVMVVLVRSRGVKSVKVRLAKQAVAVDAVKAAGFEPAQNDTLAIWNVTVQGEHPLKDGDRVEVLPPLTVDPMTARRLREEKNRSSAPRLAGGRNGSKHRLF